jgi:hypothetical protein
MIRIQDHGILRATLKKFDHDGMKNFSAAEADVLVDAARDYRDLNIAEPDFGVAESPDAQVDVALVNLGERRGTAPMSAIVYETIGMAAKNVLRYMERAKLLKDERASVVTQDWLDASTALFDFIEGTHELSGGR